MEYIPELTDQSDLRLISDSSLGKIARHLRLLGVDSDFEPEMNTNFMIYKARTEDRIVLTLRESVARKLSKLNRNYNRRLQLEREAEERKRARKLQRQQHRSELEASNRQRQQKQKTTYPKSSKREYSLAAKQQDTERAIQEGTQVAQDYMRYMSLLDNLDQIDISDPPETMATLESTKTAPETHSTLQTVDLSLFEDSPKASTVRDQPPAPTSQSDTFPTAPDSDSDSGSDSDEYYDLQEIYKQRYDNDDEDHNCLYKFYLITSKDSNEQLMEVVNRLRIEYRPESVYSRCLKCNSPIQRILPEDRHKYRSEFTDKAWNHYSHTMSRCATCNKVFWEGHYHAKCLKLASEFSYKQSQSDEATTSTTVPQNQKPSQQQQQESVVRE